MAKCAICGQREASKPNSHLIPSFIISMVSSYDGSYKRDKEMLFTFESIQNSFYAGREVIEPNYLNYFQSISEEKKTMIQDHQSFAPNNIFCPKCEEKLGNLLESKYKNNKKDGLVSIMFWMSILWRTSKFYHSAYKLPQNYEDVMHTLLDEYLQCNGKIQNKTDFINRIPFSYKLLYCPDYCKNNAGYISVFINIETNSATYFMGDFVLQIYFSETQHEHNIFGLDIFLNKALLNTGEELENKQILLPTQLQSVYQSLIEYCCNLRSENEKDYIKEIWNIMRYQLGCNIPQNPSLKFCQLFIDKIYDYKNHPYRIISDRERISILLQLVIQEYGNKILPLWLPWNQRYWKDTLANKWAKNIRITW
ncbi:MAG: hypothetical protein IKP73_18945 [Bacteroidales bacterium]|nr:hypothetical protein [Bacteroidales bacterium]MBR4624442.1 hypothetical protein [Alphaproteobacteria bacterium]